MTTPNSQASGCERSRISRSTARIFKCVQLRPWRSLRAALFVLFAFCAPEAQAAPRPNVIVVMTDDQGYGDLSCHGNPILKTPNLDRLHDQSIRLTDFHVAPMCTPTRGELMTGIDCLRNGAMNVSSGRTLLRREFRTAGDFFRDAGYATGVFGKWHLGDNFPYRPQDRGFDEAIYFPSSHISSAPDHWLNDYFDDTYLRRGERQSYQGYCTDVFFREAMRWMEQQAQAQKPFFCYLPTNAPHGPLYVSQSDRKKYSHAGQPANVASFFGMISNIDDNIGRLDNWLRERELAENTILVFLTDNGGTAGKDVFNAGMRGGKIELYEGGHRVPCFIRWPTGGLRPSGDLTELSEVQDLLPTLLDLCEIEPPADQRFDGTSLAKLLRGKTDHLPDRTLFIQFSRMNQPEPREGDACVLWRRWRLVGDKELYNLENDPGQQTNLIEKHPEIAEQLRSGYRQWWSEIAPRVNEHQAIFVGSPEEPLTSLSPADWMDVFLDQAGQVRNGLRRNGSWKIEVARGGHYEVTLRRWPEESSIPIRSGAPPVELVDGRLGAGAALPVASVRLRIGDFDQTKAVGENDTAIAFDVSPKAGETTLKTWLLDSDQNEIAGAYYVSVKRIEEK